MQDIKGKLRAFIIDNFILSGQFAEFQDGESFMDRHILDSTGFLELITFLEEHFGIEVADEEMVPENLDSMNGLEAYVLRKRAA